MKRQSKMFLAAAFAASVLACSCPTAVFAAADTADANEDVSIAFETTIVFTEEQGQLYKAAMEQDIKETIEALTNEAMMSENTYKEDYLAMMIDELAEVNVEDVFDDASCTSLTIPTMNQNITVDGVIETTDLSGEITVNEDQSEKLIERFEDNDKYEVSVSDDQIVINNQITFDEFAEGIYNMSEEMEAEGQGIKTYAKQNKGYSWGSNCSKTVVCYSTNSYPNIVYCNKCDKSTSESKGKAAWAIGGSDCAKSVRLGALALAGGIAGIAFTQSIVCVIESCQSVIDWEGDNGGTNVYCNGTKKSGNHWNCSWFTGIGHTESFHTHT